MLIKIQKNIAIILLFYIPFLIFEEIFIIRFFNYREYVNA